ncbi:unnamed protein product [Caenorhabditis angaria]|uniref:Uncharacterized protein n=1 Tax=Caenorhabditis angaria TaxID=860376 RepID=A0A9P1N1V9_9PELO|nr:unnamed protein product [Caenorhabditis angaria]
MRNFKFGPKLFTFGKNVEINRSKAATSSNGGNIVDHGTFSLEVSSKSRESTDSQKSETRLNAGSSSDSCSSDGSSLFENINQNPIIENLEIHSSEIETSQKLNYFQEISELCSNLQMKIGEIEEFIKNTSNSLGQTKNSVKFKKNELSEFLSNLANRVENEKEVMSEDRIIDQTSDFELCQLFITSCSDSYRKIRSEHLTNLIDENVMKNNMIRIAEIRKNFKNFEVEPLTEDCLTCMSFDPEEVKCLFD